MNYEKLYDNLVSYRQSNPAQGYTERHHILMRSMGGSDDPANLVVLTGREHWIAHLLLYRIHCNSHTVHACNMMAMRCEERGIPYVRNSRMYESIRKECAKLTSSRNSITHRGEGNSQYGTRWICSLELQENRKILKNEVIPEGWVAGRNRWKHSLKEKLAAAYWITDGFSNKRICYKDQSIPDGWYKGTSFNFSDDVRIAASHRTTQSNIKRKGIRYKTLA